MNMIVLLLNWLALGRPAACPDSCRWGGSLSSVQQSVVERLMAGVDEVARLTSVSVGDLGRSSRKFEGMAAVERRLAELGEALFPRRAPRSLTIARPTRLPPW